VIYTYNKYIQFIIYNNQNGIECESVVNKEQCNKMDTIIIEYGCLWLEANTSVTPAIPGRCEEKVC
jgi:formylmethanofuran dehydrogenase subunit A